MTTEELLKTLDKDSLLAVVQLMSSALLCPREQLEDLEIISGYFMTDEVFDYCKNQKTDYERLQLIQLIVNILVTEAETSSNYTQLTLAL